MSMYPKEYTREDDLKLVRRARKMFDMYKEDAAQAMNVGVTRMRYLIKEYKLKFKKKSTSSALGKLNLDKTTPAGQIMVGMVVTHDGVAYKRCSRCENIKEANCFFAQYDHASMLRSRCKLCEAEIARQRNEK